MKVDKGSLNLTVVGDWNKLYTDPVWISENLFEKNGKDIVIEMIRQPDKLVLRCRHQSVTIVPNQERMVITCEDYEKESIAYFINIARSFFQKMPSPQVIAYGFNIIFHEEQDAHFAELIDGILSRTTLSENLIRLTGNTLTFKLEMDDNRFDFVLNPKETQTQIAINNEHRVSKGEPIEINDDFIDRFLLQCGKLLKAFGYEVEVIDI